LISDFAKFDRPATLHVGFQALDAFRKETGRLPKPRNAADAEEVVKLAKKIASEANVEGLDEAILKELALQAEGELAPMIAVIGSYVAQEVLKACSGKFHPTVQYLYFDSLESLPSDAEKRLSEAECKPTGTRYDRQIAVFGRSFQERIANFREFLVGAGAIGCEMLKNWAMMGLGTGPRGKITVTDMDSIEKSNLNRQFLFRPKDLGKFKAEAAAGAVAEMNPDLKGKIESLQLAVGEQTESASESRLYIKGTMSLTFLSRRLWRRLLQQSRRCHKRAGQRPCP
jgi:ubiquitin-activating enzyme E1